MRLILFILLLLQASLATSHEASLPPLETVPFVDLNRYMGTWFEIASFPQWFSKDCVNSEAQYTLRTDGRVDVVNACRIRTPMGRRKQVTGIARVVNSATNAELKVSFFWPFDGDYWIIELDDEYQYAAVSDPSRNTLWILSRREQLDESLKRDLLERLQSKHGFELSRLRFTRQ